MLLRVFLTAETVADMVEDASGQHADGVRHDIVDLKNASARDQLHRLNKQTACKSDQDAFYRVSALLKIAGGKQAVRNEQDYVFRDIGIVSPVDAEGGEQFQIHGRITTAALPGEQCDGQYNRDTDAPQKEKGKKKALFFSFFTLFIDYGR